MRGRGEGGAGADVGVGRSVKWCEGVPDCGRGG